jgi:hypothetical protein
MKITVTAPAFNYNDLPADLASSLRQQAERITVAIFSYPSGSTQACEYLPLREMAAAMAKTVRAVAHIENRSLIDARQ